MHRTDEYQFLLLGRCCCAEIDKPSLMSSSLFPQQYPECLTRIVCEMGGKWPYSFWIVEHWFPDLFKTACSILRSRRLVYSRVPSKSKIVIPRRWNYLLTFFSFSFSFMRSTLCWFLSLFWSLIFSFCWIGVFCVFQDLSFWLCFGFFSPNFTVSLMRSSDNCSIFSYKVVNNFHRRYIIYWPLTRPGCQMRNAPV